MRVLLAVLGSLTFLLAQDAPKGSVHGVVRDAVTGTPLGGVVVAADSVATVSDAQGNYALRGLAPGETKLHIRGDANSRPAKEIAPKTVKVSAGQDAAADLDVQGQGRISGTVTDSDGKPVNGATVMLVVREYSLGELRYLPWFSVVTNARGEYGTGEANPASVVNVSGEPSLALAIGDAFRTAAENRSRTGISGAPAGIAVDAGLGYLLVANASRPIVMRAGEPVEDAAARKNVPQTMWYIGARSANGALPISPSAAERREHVDVRMPLGPAYCIQGTVHAGETRGGFLELDFAEAPLASAGFGARMRSVRALESEAGVDSKLGICGLSPGEYRVTASRTAKPGAFPLAFGSQLVTISDKDVRVSFDGQPAVRVAGEVVWDGAAPRDEISVGLRPLRHAAFQDESLSAKAPVGGTFVFDRLVNDEYEVQVSGIPPDAYLKDLLYGGQSILHAPLRAGSANLLRVVVARDGGRISAQVTDGEGNPVSDAWVVAMPAGAGSEAALADAMMWGRSDGAGMWTGPVLAPGKYFVLASLAPVDRSFEVVGRLYRSRGKAQEADIGPGATVRVKLAPMRPR